MVAKNCRGEALLRLRCGGSLLPEVDLEVTEDRGGGEGRRKEKEEKRGPGRSPGAIFKKCFLPHFQASWGPLVCVFGLLSPGSFCG